MAQRLLLVAHAPTAQTVAFTFGTAGEPHTEDVRRLNGRVASWFSGPEQACQATALRLGGEAEPIPELCECDFGSWTGRALADVALQDAPGLEAWLHDPRATPHGGESLAELTNRVGRVLDDHPWAEGRSVVVVDALVARALIVHALGANLEVIFHIDIGPLGRASLSRSQSLWRLARLETGAAVSRSDSSGHGPSRSSPIVGRNAEL
jgi:broad specificity phosphatase PhoE